MNTTLITAIVSGAIPTLIIILAIVLNRSEIGSLRSDLRKEIGELRAQQHADMLRLYELFGEHSQRITRLETQVQGR